MTEVADQILALKGKVIFHLWAEEIVFDDKSRAWVNVERKQYKRMEPGDGMVIDTPYDVFVGVYRTSRLSRSGPKVQVELS